MFLEFNLNLDVLYLKRKHGTAEQLKVVQHPFHTETGPGYGISPGCRRPFFIFGYRPLGEGTDWSEIWAGALTHFPSLFAMSLGAGPGWALVSHMPLGCSGSKCVGYLSSFLPSCSCDSCCCLFFLGSVDQGLLLVGKDTGPLLISTQNSKAGFSKAWWED